MTDAEIVALYLARDEAAISQTARQYGARLCRIANQILNDPSGAEECENDTYWEAWRRIPPHEPRDYLFAFLGRITRHLAIDVCRKNAAQKRSALLCELTAEMAECIPGPGGVEESAEASELSKAISAFLAACSAEKRTMFLRRYWYFDTVEEIGRRCACSPGKVKITLYRLREGLRAHLEKEGFSP